MRCNWSMKDLSMSSSLCGICHSMVNLLLFVRDSTCCHSCIDLGYVKITSAGVESGVRRATSSIASDAISIESVGAANAKTGTCSCSDYEREKKGEGEY